MTSHAAQRIQPIFVTQEQVRFYEEWGYLMIEDFFTHEEIDHWYGIYKKNAPPDFGHLMNLDRSEPDLRKMMKHKKIVSAIETLRHSEMVGCHTIAFFKEPRSPYGQQAWNPHQDNSYPQAENGAFVAVNVPFVEQTKENGGFYFYPGSHKAGLLPFVPTVTDAKSPGNRVEIPKEYQDKKVDIILKKGSVLFFDGNLIHGSYANHSDRNRANVVITYIKKGVSFIPGNVAKRGTFNLHGDD